MQPSFTYQNTPDFDEISYNRLREAIRMKDTNVVQFLLENKGTNVNGIGEDSLCSPLHLAVLSRHQEIVRLLLNKGADINVKCKKGDTPLTLAARMRDPVLVDLLLSYDVQNIESSSGLSHFHIACMRNNLKVVKKLLLMNQGESVNRSVSKDSPCWASYTALHFASHYGCCETVEFLLKCGADVMAQDGRQFTPLHIADLHRNEEIIDLLLSAHKLVYEKPTNLVWLSHFHIACSRNDESVVRHFLDLGVDVNQTIREWKPIDSALYYECPDVIRALMETNVYLKDSFISRSSEYASRPGSGSMYDLCVKERLKAKKQNVSCLSEFYRACAQDDIQAIKSLADLSLLNSKLNPAEPPWNGSTPLHLAVKHNSKNTLEFLLNHGADMTVKDAEGKTPFHTAFDRKLFDLIDKMMMKFSAYTANPDDNQGVSFFHIICTRNRVDIVEKFLSNGANINAQVGVESAYWAGFTPLHFAVVFGKAKIIKHLLKKGADLSIPNALALNPLELLMTSSEPQGRYKTSPNLSLTTISDITLTILSFLSDEKNNFHSKRISPLHALCIVDLDDDFELQKILAKRQNEINQPIDWPESRMYHKCTPLHLAMQSENFNLTNLLIDNGGDLLALNGVGQTPIECAIVNNGYPMWQWDDHENWDTCFSDKLPIESWFRPSHFYFACVTGLVNVVRSVLSVTTDENLMQNYLNCRDNVGRTALHTLLLEVVGESPEKQEIVHMLLQNGADVDSRDYKLQTPLHCGRLECDPIIFSPILISHGADVNAQNLFGETPLHPDLPDWKDGITVDRVILMLENGADVNIVDDEGMTCLMVNIDSFPNLNEYQKFAMILSKHVKKLQVIGFFVSDENKSMYSELVEVPDPPFDEAAFVGECTKELQKMMTINIDRRTTLHDILFKSLNEMSLYCTNIVLQDMVEKDSFVKDYPIYGYIIKLQMKNGKIRRIMLRKTVEFLNSLLQASLPQICLPMILQHLSNEDLENICSSVQMSE